jgi:hypothetical protein
MEVKDVLTQLVELAGKIAVGKSIIIAVADEAGICSTVKMSKKLEKSEPNHIPNMLVILAASHYKQHMAGNMDPVAFKIVTDDSPRRDDEPLQ